MKEIIFLVLFAVLALGTCSYLDSKRDPYEEDMRNAWGNGAMSDHGSISSFEKFIEQIKQSKK